MTNGSRVSPVYMAWLDELDRLVELLDECTQSFTPGGAEYWADLFAAGFSPEEALDIELNGA